MCQLGLDAWFGSPTTSFSVGGPTVFLLCGLPWHILSASLNTGRWHTILRAWPRGSTGGWKLPCLASTSISDAPPLGLALTCFPYPGSDNIEFILIHEDAHPGPPSTCLLWPVLCCLQSPEEWSHRDLKLLVSLMVSLWIVLNLLPPGITPGGWVGEMG